MSALIDAMDPMQFDITINKNITCDQQRVVRFHIHALLLLLLLLILINRLPSLSCIKMHTN